MSIRYLITCIAVITLAGCAGTARVPGADAVRVTVERSDLAEAELVGDAMGYCGNWWNYWLLSNEYQYANAMNMLRNHALELGGDAVLVRQINPNGTALMFMGSVYRSRRP